MSLPKSYKDNIVVDRHDNPIGQIQLPRAIEDGAILRVARVLAINDGNQILLQQRSSHVYAPLKWNETASGHVDFDESYIECALREISEEAGLNFGPDDLEEIDYFFFSEESEGYSIKRFHKVFRVNFDGQTIPEPSEVESFKWRDVGEVYRAINLQPSMFTESFKEVMRRYRPRY